MTIRVESPQFARFTNASYEVRQKQSYDWPLVQAAVAFHYEQAARLAKGVRDRARPRRPDAARQRGRGQGARRARKSPRRPPAAAGEAAAEGARPLSQNAYKVQLVEVAVKRAMLTAAGAKKYWEE